MTEQDKIDSKVVGSDRTFSVDQFDSTRIYELNIDFKKTYKDKQEARVSIKLQYIKDYKGCIAQALSNLREEKKRLYYLYTLATEQMNTLIANPSFNVHVTQNGGWYESDDQIYKKYKTHRRQAEIDLRSQSFIEVDDRRMSCYLSKTQNSKIVSSLENSNKPRYQMSSSFVKNQESGVLNSSALYNSALDEVEGKSSVVIKENKNGEINPGSYLNYM